MDRIGRIVIPERTTIPLNVRRRKKSDAFLGFGKRYKALTPVLRIPAIKNATVTITQMSAIWLP
jgi:hypothetical protein